MNFAVNTLMPCSFSAMLVNHFLFRFNECRKNLQVGFTFIALTSVSRLSPWLGESFNEAERYAMIFRVSLLSKMLTLA